MVTEFVLSSTISLKYVDVNAKPFVQKSSILSFRFILNTPERSVGWKNFDVPEWISRGCGFCRRAFILQLMSIWHCELLSMEKEVRNVKNEVWIKWKGSKRFSIFYFRRGIIKWSKNIIFNFTHHLINFVSFMVYWISLLVVTFMGERAEWRWGFGRKVSLWNEKLKNHPFSVVTFSDLHVMIILQGEWIKYLVLNFRKS